MGADFHLALHSNAGGKGKAWGPIAFYHTGGKPLCQQLISQLKAIGQESNRASSIQRKITLYELNATKAITCLLEVDFHDSEKGVAFITGHRAEIAEAIAKAVAAIDGTQWVGADVQEDSLAQQKCSTFFDADENGSYRWEEPLTRQEAAVALLRLQNQLAKEV